MDEGALGRKADRTVDRIGYFDISTKTLGNEHVAFHIWLARD